MKNLVINLLSLLTLAVLILLVGVGLGMLFVDQSFSQAIAHTFQLFSIPFLAVAFVKLVLSPLLSKLSGNKPISDNEPADPTKDD
jgi:hypothetical protein